MTPPDTHKAPEADLANPWQPFGEKAPGTLPAPWVDVEFLVKGRMANEGKWADDYEITHWRPYIAPKPGINPKEEMTEGYKGFTIHATKVKAEIVDPTGQVIRKLTTEGISTPMTFVSRAQVIIDEAEQKVAKGMTHVRTPIVDSEGKVVGVEVQNGNLGDKNA